MKRYLNSKFDYAALVDYYDELPLWSAPFGLKLLGMVNYRPAITALDIGFGTGFPLTELAMRLGDTSTVYGIDPWHDAIVRAKRKLELYGIQHVRILEGRAESIPLTDRSVDLIVSNNGINNVHDISKVLSECSRLCRPGAQFVLTMNLDKSMFEFYSVFENVLAAARMDHEIELMHQHIRQKRLPLGEIMAQLQGHDFMIQDLEHDQFDYRFTNGTAMLNHYFIRLAFMDAWVNILPEDKIESLFDQVEVQLNQQANILGGLKLSIPFVAINAFRK